MPTVIPLPEHELVFSFTRSSGPGGQNVNKTATKVVLRWAVACSDAIPEAVRERFLTRHARRVTRDGEVVLTSDRTRERERNMTDVRAKLAALLAEVALAPKRRRPTKPGPGARERRLDGKRVQAAKKRGRGAVLPEQD